MTRAREVMSLLSEVSTLSSSTARRSLYLFAALTFLLSLISYSTLFQNPNIRLLRAHISSTFSTDTHPIDQLLRESNKEFDNLVNNGALSVAAAARNYRARRGRHPPPEFDAWFHFAEQKNVLVVESLFDQIYEDLEPFWGVEPSAIQRFIEQFPTLLTVRNHTVNLTFSSNETVFLEYGWMAAWEGMANSMPPLPDVELAVALGDEPHLLVPFERISRYMAVAETNRQQHMSVPYSEIRSAYPTHTGPSTSFATAPPKQLAVSLEGRDYWDFILDTCKPDDPVFSVHGLEPHSKIPPVFSKGYTAGTIKGYVSNFTASKNVCHNPNLKTLHGHMIQPNLDYVYTDLFPIFGVAKMTGVSNEILLPPPTHWGVTQEYDGLKETIAWSKKQAKAIWRGSATGGSHNRGNWYGFHRHRLVAMMNGTTVARNGREPYEPGLPLPDSPAPSQAEERSTVSDEHADPGLHNIPYPSPHLFDLAALRYNRLGEWSAEISDGGFTQLYCYPYRLASKLPTCSYTDPYYRQVPKLGVDQIMAHKYLPDVDGQSSSGRFRGFMQSLSVPIKASIFSEWHDNRFIPWHHFVPMSNEYQEWWGLMEYFVGYKGRASYEQTVKAHDKAGEAIGRQGSEWTRRVIRKDDMVAYFYRVILEYARICAENRNELGYVQDLTD